MTKNKKKFYIAAFSLPGAGGGDDPVRLFISVGTTVAEAQRLVYLPRKCKVLCSNPDPSKQKGLRAIDIEIICFIVHFLSNPFGINVTRSRHDSDAK